MICWQLESETEILCNPFYYPVHGILQARILEWAAFPFPGGSSQPRDGTQVSHNAGGFFTIWATRKAQGLGEVLWNWIFVYLVGARMRRDTMVIVADLVGVRGGVEGMYWMHEGGLIKCWRIFSCLNFSILQMHITNSTHAFFQELPPKNCLGKWYLVAYGTKPSHHPWCFPLLNSPSTNSF